MKKFRLWTVLSVLAVMAFAGLGAEAALVQKMELPEVCARADKIFRGIVLSAKEGTTEAGGGVLPTMTYTIKVTENYQGEYVTKGDLTVAEITTLGRVKATGSPLADLPELEIGRDYFLMMTSPSPIGLSAPVGLGQGCYTVSGKAGQEIATDGYGNTVNYAELASAVQAALVP